MTCLIQCKSERGINEVYNLPDKRLKELSFGIVNLKEGDRFGETLNKREAVLIVLNGKISLKGDGYSHGLIDEKIYKQGQYSGAIYCPPGIFAIKAITDCKVAIFRRWCADKYKGKESALISPSQISSKEFDKIITQTIFVNDDQESGFSVGEAFIIKYACEITEKLFSTSEFKESEVIIYFGSNSSEVCGDFSLSGDYTEKDEIKKNQTLIIPENCTLNLNLNKDTYCVWMKGKVKKD